MPKTDAHTENQDAPRHDEITLSAATSPETVSPSLAVVAAAVAILAAGWFAAGSVGLMGAAFLRASSWTALGVAVILVRPTGKALASLGATVAVLVGLPFVISAVPGEILSLPGYDLLLVVAVASVLAAARNEVECRAIMASAVAVAALAVFRIGCDCIPTAADGLGRGLGTVVAAIYGRELWVGSSFGGVDFLVAMTAFSAVWLWHGPRPRLGRAIYAATAILAVQFIYLTVLSQAENLIAALPALPPPPSIDPVEYRPPDWSMAAALRGMLPWGLPLVAMAGDLLVAACMLRWARCRSVENEVEDRQYARADSGRFARAYLPLTVVAALAAVVLTCAACPSDLSGKKIVAYADADVWTLPEHGEQDLVAADGYGMLSSFVASLGGEFAVSQPLSGAELDGADVLIVIDPAKPLPEETLARVHDFVRGGGSLLLLAGPAAQDAHNRATLDAILEPTGMSVRFDTAVAQTPHWQDACRVFVHPATVAVNPRRNQFALNLGSSIATHDVGQPILVGRWGWCEPGSDMAAAGAPLYGPGEKLGDIVLAAERGLGDGTVVVLSDTTGLTNIGLVAAHPFAGRLLGYLAGRRGNPRVWWRQLLGVVLLAVLVRLIVGRRSDANYPSALNRLASRLAVAAVVFAIALAASASVGREVGKVLPDGRLPSARPIAYIDAAHFGINSDEPWVPQGTGGFAVTLMRNGYMPLAMYETSDERLDRAAMLTVIGPGKPFSVAERESIGRFVDRGGLLVCAIGAEESPAAHGLLSDFRFVVPHSPVAPGDDSPEPAPVGRYPDEFGRAFMPYLKAKDYGRGDYMVHTWFHQPWPVKCYIDNATVSNLVFGYEGQPIVVDQQCDKGHVVVIGDSHFVLNENLGYVDGLATNSVESNLDFWRWCLGRVTGSHDWFPPDRRGNAEQKQEQPAVANPPDTQKEPPQKIPKEKSQNVSQENPLRPEPLQPVEVKP